MKSHRPEHVTPDLVRRWLSSGVSPHEVGARIAADRITPDDLERWFTLTRTPGPWPQGEALQRLARDIAHFRETAPPGALADLRAENYRKVMDATQHLNAALENWSALEGLNPDEAADHPFEQLATYLIVNGFVGGGYGSNTEVRRRRRPREVEHRVARDFAELLKRALVEAGQTKRLRERDEEGVIAVVGAAFIERHFGRPFTPAGFATAMRDRDRSKRSRPKREVRIRKVAAP